MTTASPITTGTVAAPMIGKAQRQPRCAEMRVMMSAPNPAPISVYPAVNSAWLKPRRCGADSSLMVDSPTDQPMPSPMPSRSRTMNIDRKPTAPPMAAVMRQTQSAAGSSTRRRP